MLLGYRSAILVTAASASLVFCSTKAKLVSGRQSSINGGNIQTIATGVAASGDAVAVSPAPSILAGEAQKQEDQIFPPTPGALAPRRLWRLTVPQLANTVRTLLNSKDAIEAKFDTETRPTSGLGVESDILQINGDYASVLENVLSPLTQASAPALQTYLPCGSAAAINPSCLSSFITSFGGKAFRRPVTDAEIKRYEALYNAVQPASSNADALAAVADALLRSPYTQFRTELGDADKGGTVTMTPSELATNLAYSITNGPPDQELLAAAASGDLAKPEVLSAQASRLLSSSGFVGGFTEFFLRYTGVAWLSSMPKDSKLFPDYTQAMMQAMIDETKAYVKDVMITKKGDFHALLSNQPTTIAPVLAGVYGVPTFATPTQKITPNAAERAGLFTLPAVIAANSKSADTSPVKRGVFLLGSLVCVQPLPPPPNIPTLMPNVDPNATLRQRFAAHVASPSCAGCHNLIDPFGFAMENYDPIGRHRSTDNGTPVDASGTVSGTQFSNTSFTSAVDLLKSLGSSPDVYGCLVKNAFRYTFGRPETAGDAPVLRSAYEHFVASNLDINQIFLSFYTSAGFQQRKAD